MWSCVAVLAVVGPFLSVARGGPLFDHQVVPASVDENSWLVAADLNGDGAADIVTTESSRSIAVVLNRGDGVFLDSVTYSLGAAIPFGLAVDDLDGDGDLDLVVATVRGGRILLNHGDGVFDEPVVLFRGDDAHAVQVGDLDGDGDPDLVFTGMATDTLMVWLNHGDATFESFPVTLSRAVHGAFALADLDSDGDLDVAAVIENHVVVFLNRGDMTFARSGRLPTAFQTAIGYGDLDGDGDIDLLTHGRGQADLAIFPNRGDATFGAPLEFDFNLPNFTFRGVACADYDGDGDRDVAVVGGAGVLLVNAGGLNFTVFEDRTSQFGGYSIATADFDGDGLADLATESRSFVYLALNHGRADFGDIMRYSALSYPQQPVVDDLDQDGDLDIAVSNASSPGASVLLNSGGGLFGPPHVVRSTRFGVSIAAGDLDADGDLDLIVANADPTGDMGISVMINSGRAQFSAAEMLKVGQPPSYVALGDWDRDGDLDLASVGDDDLLRVFYNTGDASFVEGPRYMVDPLTRFVFAADLNGDTRLDLVTLSSRSDAASLFLNQGDGCFVLTGTVLTGRGPIAAVASDLDEDGDLDLAVVEAASGELSVAPNNGDATFAPRTTYSVGTNASFVVADDLDGDGHVDLAVANAGSPYTSLLLGRGDGTFSPVERYFNRCALAVAAGDLDDDGDADLVLSSLSFDNNISILRNNTRLTDCNGNGVRDRDDIEDGLSMDRDANLVPDDCQCLGDLTGDGVVDEQDLSVLLDHFGMPHFAGDLDGDLDHDRDVDLRDLGLLLAVFGQGCL